MIFVEGEILSCLQVITITEKEKWDKTVKSFRNYEVNYLSGYAEAFQLHGDGEPILFYYDDGCTKAINVVMKRDISASDIFKDKLASNTWY